MFDVYITQNKQLLFNCNVHLKPNPLIKLSELKQKYAYYKFEVGVGLLETFCWSTIVKHDGGWEKPE